ncbi:hypothetical protein M758_2G008200 [Ceratodon purpureus]|nr:hypothetical protein M758_2G008200 [Ceratodon purpureus]
MATGAWSWSLGAWNLDPGAWAKLWPNGPMAQWSTVPKPAVRLCNFYTLERVTPDSSFQNPDPQLRLFIGSSVFRVPSRIMVASLSFSIARRDSSFTNELNPL